MQEVEFELKSDLKLQSNGFKTRSNWSDTAPNLLYVLEDGNQNLHRVVHKF
jgi:hypothetical protein